MCDARLTSTINGSVPTLVTAGQVFWMTARVTGDVGASPSVTYCHPQRHP